MGLIFFGAAVSLQSLESITFGEIRHHRIYPELLCSLMKVWDLTNYFFEGALLMEARGALIRLETLDESCLGIIHLVVLQNFTKN